MFEVAVEAVHVGQVNCQVPRKGSQEFLFQSSSSKVDSF